MPTHIKANSPNYENGVYYPSADENPMPESELHFDVLALLVDALRNHFATNPNVYAVGDIFWYWEEGNPQACRSPDAMVIFGVHKERRNSFRSWNEGGAIPRVCFEIASENTWRANLAEVRDDYERVGVREYFVFDPTRDFLPAALMGFRLRNGVYQPMRAAADGSLTSRELSLKLLPEGIMLRLVDAKSGERVLTAAERADAEQERADAEQERAEVEREQKETERRRADIAVVRAEEERQRAEKECLQKVEAQQQADAERQRADQFAMEIQRLQALLAQQNQGKDAAP